MISQAASTETGEGLISFEVYLRGDFVAGSAVFNQNGEFDRRDPNDISEIHLYPKQNQYEDNLPPESLTLDERKKIYEAVFDAYDVLREAKEEIDG